MLIFPALELLEGRLKPWAKKSCRKGRETASCHLGSQGCKLHLQQGKWVVLAGATKRKRCCAVVPFKSSFFGVQMCHRGMISDNDKESTEMRTERCVHRHQKVSATHASQGHRKPSGWQIRPREEAGKCDRQRKAGCVSEARWGYPT